MTKLILNSVLLATFVLPMRAASDKRSAARGFRRMIVMMVVFDAFYMVGLLAIYKKLLPH